MTTKSLPEWRYVIRRTWACAGVAVVAAFLLWLLGTGLEALGLVGGLNDMPNP